VLLTTRRRFSEGEGDGDGAAEEIDAGGRCRRRQRGVTLSGRGRRSPRRGILVRAEREAREDARRPRRSSPTTRGSGRPAMVRRRDSLRWCMCEGREVQSVNECARVRAGALGRAFIGRGGGEGAMSE
jgi:hypothetical protein